MKKERIKAQVSDLVLNEGQIVWLPKNPRQWTQTAIDNLKKSLERDSDFQEDRPLLVLRYEDKWLVFGGNLRTTAAKALRWNIIDAICYTPECEEDKEIIKRRAILDNGSFGEWDVDALAVDWNDIDLSSWGVNVSWDEVSKEDLHQDKVEVQEDEFDAEKDVVKTRCTRGDVWQLGDHRLMCGDSTSEEDIKILMGGGRG